MGIGGGTKNLSLCPSLDIWKGSGEMERDTMTELSYLKAKLEFCFRKSGKGFTYF